jgi:predicted nuclease of predicted toxin-antitoxin system
MRFLIDECLSPSLVLVAHDAGYEAQHVNSVGKSGWTDWKVADYASTGDFVLVTNNGSDFLRLYAARPIHAGLVILIPSVSRALQRQLFKEALTELAKLGELVNQVLEIDMEGDDVTFEFYDLPPGRGD